MVWDVALGIGTTLRLGSSPVAMLRWSPHGDYLFAGEGGGGYKGDAATTLTSSVVINGAANAHVAAPECSSIPCARSTRHINLRPQCVCNVAAGLAGRFHMWETSKCHASSWDTPAGGVVVSAAWGPDGKVLLIALSHTSTLVALHLVGEAPSLVEQMLPVTLPHVSGFEPR